MTDFRSKLWAKLTAMTLLILLAVVCLVSSAGVVYLAGEGAYTGDAYQVLENRYFAAMESENQQVRNWYANAQAGYTQDFADAFSKERTNLSITVIDENGNILLQNYQDEETGLQYENDYWLDTYDEAYYEAYEEGTDIAVVEKRGLFGSTAAPVQVHIVSRLRTNLEAQDAFYYLNFWLGKLLAARYILVVVSALTLLMGLALYIFLLCAAGHKEGVEGITLNWVDRIPFDLYLVFLAGAVAVSLEFYYTNYMSGWEKIPEIAALLLVWFQLAVGLTLTFAARAKAGILWKNTVLWRVWKLFWRCLTNLAHGIAYAAGSLHLYWRFALGWGGLCLLELLLLAVWDCESDAVFLWFLEKLVLTPVLLLTVLNGKKLLEAGHRIANGELDFHVDLRHMHLDLRRHGENLNSISAGVQLALEERMKSERLKTELITNVSHDIKTPLTSIVNYVDLLKKQDVQPEAAKEYIAVLDRQSARLKKLTEDLVEASKAATGNIPVNLEPTDVGMLLNQAAGEYQDKLEANRLETVITCQANGPMILADGKLLWRVFDNLLSNICKYALEGTRVYLSAQVSGSAVEIVFKNISRYPLNISAQELMERFVRGDASRSTEGSGLGLSIARSLTDLQGGVFELMTDGDLFKAMLGFPVIA